MTSRLGTRLTRGRKALTLTVRRFNAIEGTQSAAAFAYYAFFSIFPLFVLFVTVAATVVDRDVATRRVISYFETFAPVAPEMRRQVFDTISHLVKARAKFGAFATVVLFWGALQFFKALIRATNRAWGAPVHNWWRMPFKSLLLVGLMGSSLALGIGASIAKRAVRSSALYADSGVAQINTLFFSIVSLAILFYSLAFFYKIAPRRTTPASDIWAAAAFSTMGLRALGVVFVFYLRHFSQVNAIYGAFGGLMALLLWIYLSGCIIILGACFAAGMAELRGQVPRLNPSNAANA